MREWSVLRSRWSWQSRFEGVVRMGHRVSCVWLGWPLLLLGASATPDSCSEVQPTVGDSLGVRIVNHGHIELSPLHFTISETPILTLSEGLESDWRNPFHVVRPLSTGGWAVMNMSAIRLFDRSGRMVRTIGRKGHGPAEFQQLRDICVQAGDTLVAIGYSNRKAQRLTIEGEQTGALLLDGVPIPDSCLPDASFLIRGPSQTNPATTIAAARAPILDLVAEVSRVSWRTPTPERLGVLPAPARDYFIPSAGPLVASPSHIVAGTGLMPVFSLLSHNGSLRTRVRWKATPRPIGMRLRRATGTRSGASIRTTLPFYTRLLTDAEGRVWVSPYRDLRAPERWLVFDGSGNHLGNLTLPSGYQGASSLVWVGGDQLMLYGVDDQGAGSFTLHHLRQAH